ncbi:MAG: translation initiation factor Sui1 [Calditrichia bacterium]
MKDKQKPGLVYSTESGRMCPDCGKPINECICSQKSGGRTGDGILRIRREVKGRHGKTATTISGLPLEAGALNDLASELKQKCGTGGSVKDGVIVIQGDQRDKLLTILKEKEFTVKLAGG